MKPLRVKPLFLLGAVIVLSSSCLQQRHTCYMQNETVDGEVYTNHLEEYKIRPHNVLYIRIMGMNDEIVAQFNMYNTTGSSYNNEFGLYINGYLVSDSGGITLPVLGTIKVAGNTLQEAQQLIQKEVDTYIKNASVIVRLVNFEISVFGEVGRPGVYSIYNDRINLFELLSRAGDITIYGNKKQAMLIRETNEGAQTFTIDLTDNNIMSSGFYYLQPNDILYIRPISAKSLRQNTTNLTSILSIISTLMLIINFIQ